MTAKFILLTWFLAMAAPATVDPLNCVPAAAALGTATHAPSELSFELPAERTFAVYPDYVAIDFPFAPFERLFHALNQNRLAAGKLPLKNRGEVHLTLLRPGEIKELQKVLTPEDWQNLPAIAKELGVTTAPLEIVTVGTSRARIQQKQDQVEAETVYLVVKSGAAAAFRAKISELAQRRRQEAGRTPAFTFEPAVHAPHVTLGFTHRDLHETDGVDKTKPDVVMPLTGAP